MLTAMRRLQFCAGHRVFQHESKCANMHGHNYVVRVFAVPDEGSLDPLGRVIDFSVLKEKLGGWIELNWDHGFLVFEKDEAVLAALRSVGGKRYTCPFNPTAENLAHFLLYVVGPIALKDTGVSLHRVELDETENCTAVADLYLTPPVHMLDAVAQALEEGRLGRIGQAVLDITQGDNSDE